MIKSMLCWGQKSQIFRQHIPRQNIGLRNSSPTPMIQTKVVLSTPEIICSSKTKHHLDIVLIQIILIDDLNVRTMFVNIFSQSEIFEKFLKFYELMISVADALVSGSFEIVCDRFWSSLIVPDGPRVSLNRVNILSFSLSSSKFGSCLPIIQSSSFKLVNLTVHQQTILIYHWLPFDYNNCYLVFYWFISRNHTN